MLWVDVTNPHAYARITVSFRSNFCHSHRYPTQSREYPLCFGGKSLAFFQKSGVKTVITPCLFVINARENFILARTFPNLLGDDASSVV